MDKNGAIVVGYYNNWCQVYHILGTSRSSSGNAAGGAAAGRGFELRSTHDLHRGFSPFLTGAAFSRVELHRDSGAPIAYGALDCFDDLLKDAILESMCSCRVYLCT